MKKLDKIKHQLKIQLLKTLKASYNVGLIIEKFFQTKKGKKIIKLSFLIPILMVIVAVYPSISFLIFTDFVKFMRPPMNIGFPMQKVYTLLLYLWGISLVIFLLKEILLSIGVFKMKEAKGLFYYWNNIMVMPFLNIFITSFFILIGVGIASSVQVLENPNDFLKMSVSPMNYQETLLYRAALLSCLYFCLQMICTQFYISLSSKL